MTKKLDKLIIILFIVIVGLCIYLLFHNDTITLRKIILDKREMSIYLKEKNIINVSFEPKDATDKSIVWKSNNPNIAIVDSKGVVSGINTGSTDIIVSTTDGRITGKCHVLVKERKVESIKLDDTDMTLRVGNKKKLSLVVLPENATNKKVSYISSDRNVLSIDENGNMTAKKVGQVVVTVKSVNNIKASSNITVVDANTVLVNSVKLNKSSLRLDVGKEEKLHATISPSNAYNKKINWSSSNTSIATVDSNGNIRGIKDGIVTITAKSIEGGKKATCKVTVRANPIVPLNDVTYKYDGIALKYYIQNNNSYYLTYIWMDDPYTQTRKLESTVAKYGKLMTDTELSKAGKKSVRMTIGDMLNSYIKSGRIPKDKAAIAYNASGFYDKRISTWKPVSDYYDLRTNSWFVITEGKVTRKRLTEKETPQSVIIGIAPSGELKIYDGKVNGEEDRKKKSDLILSDHIKNTWSFSPVLIKNGKVITSSNNQSAYREAICQINTNNYVVLTSITAKRLSEVSTILQKIGCKTAFNLDGGGSISMFYKQSNTTSVTKVKCSDGSSHNTCRSVVDGIYFIEK